MRNLLLTLFAVIAIVTTGCRTPQSAVTAPPAPYTRIANPDANTVQLQIALRKFVPAHHRGPAIWLAGTMHVGEPEYYHAVQKFLDGQTVVLFEGINTETHPRHVKRVGKPDAEPAAPPQEPSGTNAGTSMQATLAKSLGLVFQLDAIDYDRTNFLNSDISVQQIQRLMTGGLNAPPAPAGQPSKSNPTFDALLQVMDGSSLLGSLFKAGIELIGSNPKLQALTKLTLIEAIGRLKGDFSGMRGMPPDLKQLVQVLIEARNQNVIADLQTELKTVPRRGSIAVFYGTGHMDDMERRLTTQLHYRPAEDVWLTAFSVDMKKADISPSEAQVMRNLVKWQLDQMQ